MGRNKGMEGMIPSRKILIAHKNYTCESCGRVIISGNKYMRLFGSTDDACKNSKTYEIKVCNECMTKNSENQIKAGLK